MTLTLGFSTCPNDTFIFDALVHHKIDTEGLDFEVQMADVEELNRNAFCGSIDVTKLSYHAFAYAANNYKLLCAGSALGYKNGPLVISKRKIYPDEVADATIAIPGKFTTANLLFSITFPHLKQKKEYLFSEIEDAIAGGEVDAGVIIHENRFTYQKKGLKKIVDLGEKWEQKTKHPIPLGGIVVHRKIDLETQQKMNRVLRRSVKFALENPSASYDYVKNFAQEMDDEVIEKHIGLYVNEFTVDLGEKGKEAIEKLFKEATREGIIPSLPENIFVC
ncbi:MAG: 1,4-dihydroxy-6-naphthoate synthase [Prolixibacteraceae bacterium]|nr:1,4-dihydroxy-6-naphthoate synthase [Prolixibacteraceae bacterium]